HVVTVNDYLASRDCDEMRVVYESLGLSVGCVVQGMSHEERKAVYACDIVYCTNKELVFDYLKDQIEMDKGRHALQLHAQRLKGGEAVAEKILIKGLHFAIIDEVDSVLMDEAITPLIISATVQENERESEVYQQALAIAKNLIEDMHFSIDYVKRSVSLLQQGEQLAQEQAESLGPFWRGRVRRIELVSKALSALFLFHKDEHYLLRENKVQIIDQHTGRVMPDRTWEKGLHQLIEFKEDCELTKPRVTLEKISYQRFFRFYHHIAGMTGTAREVQKEFWSVYQLPVITIPSYRKNRRVNFKAKVCYSLDEKWPLVANAVSESLDQGRAVLVGTGSVASSELLSAQLTEQGICHQLLNAKQDEDEADIIAAAGQSGTVTIATSMAGRGTDIKLADSVAQAGGLHVILTELQESSRIDRQLEGRCARMGDSGSVERIVSIEDVIAENLPNIWFQLVARIPQRYKLNKIISLLLLRMAQKTLEKRHLKLRSTLLKVDERQDELLAFAGQRI
ncbi:MAG: prepilin peptidase, partial [Cellvibrionales bacterium]|nr:prepilin peptidase [Cellvibrionales bacterium]